MLRSVFVAGLVHGAPRGGGRRRAPGRARVHEREAQRVADRIVWLCGVHLGDACEWRSGTKTLLPDRRDAAQAAQGVVVSAAQGRPVQAAW